MARIYTKTGDDGTTGLLYGGRVSKSDELVEVCGDIDEAVAALGPEMVGGIEQTIDAIVSERPLGSVFVVPGTTSTEAHLDLARGITRRAERHAIKARTAGRPVDDHVLRYLNRVSDLLYVIARHSVGDAEEPSSHE
jgi:cob(I)alamin adenosyltransferase